ncbi:hypothetical protein [Nonomuraea angiospora]|uniref:hypothetical protein n=1 Tax=Nonomuraea angiospora TaxID=46172 RepID=UPI0029B2461D|nr:hypothetical protein [Nonomuraea angiospora]MDX3101748.1 hypothetical protein [Nonomuraea angiospora]
MATRHNLCPNPALANSNTGWGGGETPVRTDGTGQGFPRTWVARYSTSTFMWGPTGAASAGLAYTFSTYVRPTNFSVGGTLAIQWLDSGLSEVSESTVAFPTAPTGVATRVSITGTAPVGSVWARILAFGEDYSGNPCNFSAVLYEQVAALDTYFDGASPGASWDGTVGESTSTLIDATPSPPPRPYAGARRRLLVR